MKLKFYCFSRGWLVLASMLLCSSLFAQRTITGTVTDAENGEPLIGANILIVGTSTGTITDFDGKYSLEIPEGTTQLQFSYTGYSEKTVDIGASSVLDVTLSAGELLEEVVVIGYGTVKKGDATGAVNAVGDEDFNKGAIVSADQLLTGKVAGVQISTASGEPGGQSTIRIRGGTSVNASNEPLYVIDGVPIDNAPHNAFGGSNGRNPLNFLNPSDIETFTVLKDASATAIYGSRGANGVIIITTKKGKAGSRSNLTYDGYYTTAKVLEQPRNFNAEEFSNLTTFVAPNRLDQLGNANTNWYDEVLQTATGHNHNLSFSGGAENIGYRISLGYQNLEGIVRTSETERTSVAINYNQTLLDGRLKINANIRGAQTNDQFDPGVVGAATGYDPTQPVLNPDDPTFAGFFEYGSTQGARNPVSSIEQIQDFGKSFRTLGNIDFEYKLDDLVPGLSAKLILGVDINNGQRKKFQPTTYLNPLVSNRTGEIRIENFNRTNELLDFYLTYNKDFGVHSINFTAGYSYQDFRSEFPSIEAFDLPNDQFDFDRPQNATEFRAFNSVVENRLISFFGRANYSFKDKYLLTASLRRDGSTRFGLSNRWGLFPSAAFAWRILEEDFASGLENIFSDLKLRISYGVTGNQEIGDFLFLPRYTTSTATARAQFGNSFVTTARPDGYDAGLKWEETVSYNIGLDFGFSNGRINGSLEYYNKRTDDLLFTVNVPAGTNLTDRVLTNIGELENTGVELTLNAAVIDTRKLSWNIAFNAAYNNNEILAIDQVGTGGILTGGIAGGVGNNVQVLEVGQPVNSFFLFEHLQGSNGLPLPEGIDHNDDGAIDDLDLYVDRNGDGVINDSDKRPIEKPAPDFLFGLTSNVNFQNFDLSFTLRANLGNYVYNNNASQRGYFNHLDERGDIFLNNLHQSVLLTNYQSEQYFSDYYLEDAAFLRMDNITLGYTFPNLGNNRSLRVYATAQNLFTLTEYTGFDPEVVNIGSDRRTNGGIDNSPYPRARTLIFGLSLGL